MKRAKCTWDIPCIICTSEQWQRYDLETLKKLRKLLDKDIKSMEKVK